jgi:hypothetical protein
MGSLVKVSLLRSSENNLKEETLLLLPRAFEPKGIARTYLPFLSLSSASSSS